MKSLFWVALNFIGFVILIFMYSYKNKSQTDNTETSAALKTFKYLLLSIMLFIIFDTGMYLFDGASFNGAWILNYISTMLFYLICPLPGLFYLLYCDKKLLKNHKGFKKWNILYFIPVVINTIAVALTPFTNLIFYIDENNIYSRGSLFWLSVVLAFILVLSVYPLLISQSKKGHSYLYIFPLPSIVLTIIQVIYYGVLLIGFGFVLSAFLLYINSAQSLKDKRSLSTRFYNLNIIQFIIISTIMIIGMFWVLENTTDKISTDYAAYNSAGAAHILETYLNKEIGVLGTTARSGALTEWIADEYNTEKKRAAYDVLVNTLNGLYNNNVYIVAKNTGQEYTLDNETSFYDFRSHASISPDNPKDKWVYDLMAQEHDYNLNVDVDKEFHRKRVWLNFKITSGQETIGIICTGMDLSDIAEQVLLLQAEHSKSRTFIIDENGIINMDSELFDKDDFLLYGIIKNINEEVTDPVLLAEIQTHLDNISGYFSELYKNSAVIRLHTGSHKYATITPIGTTSWTLVTLYDSSSLYSITNLLPLLVIIISILIIFGYSSNTIAKRLIFIPLKQLIDSINNMRKNNEQNIFGADRKDEIGLLSNAVQDYFVKGYYDELTGIFNRRYFETTFQQIMTMFYRAESKLSVMLIDIDFFKKFNDTYGHSQGDNCLKLVAAALNKTIMRKGDFIARYGGEEFVAVLPYADEEGARILAENMLQAVRDLKIPHSQSNENIVTISIGITTSVNTAEITRDILIEKADKALYMSKENGRNGYTFLALTD